jgi:hypothetical protein
MKKIITILLCSFFGMNALQAQTPYASTNYASAGDTAYITRASLTSAMKFDTTGVNITWDYSALVPVTQNTELFKDPTQAGFTALQFPYIYNSNNVNLAVTNGQTYFGRLERFGPSTVVLFDAYYLQVGETTTTETADATADATATDGSNLQLKKLSDDFHQPNNYLVLNRDHILYWQHLSDSSPIIEAMVEYQSQ